MSRAEADAFPQLQDDHRREAYHFTEIVLGVIDLSKRMSRHPKMDLDGRRAMNLTCYDVETSLPGTDVLHTYFYIIKRFI